jgi:hypothetical protein
VTRTLPPYIELRRERITESWFLLCRACGIKETYDKFWPASYAAHAHADLHEARGGPRSMYFGWGARLGAVSGLAAMERLSSRLDLVGFEVETE